jgi:hypothetical protein
VDPALFASLTQLSQSCKVDVAQGAVNCPKGELRALVAKFASNQESRVKSVPTFAAALKDERPEVRAATANVLHSGFSSMWGPDARPGSVPAADAQALLSGVTALGPAQLRQALPAAVHASMLSGQSAALYAALEKLPAEAKAIGYRSLMTHGRLQAFDKVKELAKDKDTAIVLAALENPRSMSNWTEQEQAAICPWVVEFLNDARPVVVSKAAGVLTSCGGEHIDKLLDMVEQALKAKTLFTAKISAFRDLCLVRQRTTEHGPTDAQCDRARKLLEQAVDNKALDAQARGMALVALAHQWPDKKTLALAKRHEKSSEKALAEHAGRVVQRIDQVQRASSTKGAPSAQPGPAKPGGPPTPGGAAAKAPAPAPPAPAAPAAPPEAEGSP